MFNSLPQLLQEREFPCRQWIFFDKAFTCVSPQNLSRLAFVQGNPKSAAQLKGKGMQAWLSSQQVVVGTKCNKLLLVTADRCRSPGFPLLQSVHLPAAPSRPAGTATYPAWDGAVHSALWSIQAQRSDRNSGSSAGAFLVLTNHVEEGRGCKS